jgi:hypothetical protein
MRISESLTNAAQLTLQFTDFILPSPFFAVSPSNVIGVDNASPGGVVFAKQVWFTLQKHFVSHTGLIYDKCGNLYQKLFLFNNDSL